MSSRQEPLPKQPIPTPQLPSFQPITSDPPPLVSIYSQPPPPALISVSTINPLPPPLANNTISQELYQSETLTIPQVLSRLEELCQLYPNEIDLTLYQLNLFSTPVDHSVTLNNGTILPQLHDEPVPLSQHHIMLDSIIKTCEYIIKRWFPFQDDACELFLIQAQAYIRYGDWDQYPKILKYLSYATRCCDASSSLSSSSSSSSLSPPPSSSSPLTSSSLTTTSATTLQQNRIALYENIAYGYKYKSLTQTTLYNIVKTWVGFQSLLTSFSYFFPTKYTTNELIEYDRSQVGTTYQYTDENGRVKLYRDITKYVYHKEFTDAQASKRNLSNIQRFTELNNKDAVPSRVISPEFK